jgi:hypothetical protein
MRFPTMLLLATITIGAAGAPAAESLSPEKVEAERPQGTVTVRFRVATGAVLTGLARPEDPPYMPILLDAGAKLKDPRNRLYVVLCGKALAHVHNLGLGNLEEHFVGRTIEATGKVRYLALPQITKRDGTVETPADSFTHYEIQVQSLDDFRVVE